MDSHISNKAVGSPYNQMIYVPPTRGVMPYYAIPQPTVSSPLTLSLSRAQSIVQKIKQSKKGGSISAPNTPAPELSVKRDSSDMDIDEVLFLCHSFR